jgi:hypothetical protein
MNQEKRAAKAVLWIVALFFLGFSLFINLPAVHSGFLSADQAVYYAMAQSIAFDNDLEYTKKDLIRYYEDFGAGPNGIFLKKAADGKLYYAKSFVYALFAAPFVRVFGSNGPLVFHSLLLLLLLLMGFSYFSLSNSPGLSLLQVITFLFASIAGVYFLWISPDFFNLFLVFAALFLWLYKIRRKEAPPAAPEANLGRFQAFLLSESSDYLAVILAGIAVFSKPPNVALMGPLVASAQEKIFKDRGFDPLVRPQRRCLFRDECAIHVFGMELPGRRAQELLFQLSVRKRGRHIRQCQGFKHNDIGRLLRPLPVPVQIHLLQYFLLFLRPLYRHRLVLFSGLPVPHLVFPR